MAFQAHVSNCGQQHFPFKSLDIYIQVALRWRWLFQKQRHLFKNKIWTYPDYSLAVSASEYPQFYLLGG